jgi:hypothetical protein
MVQTKSQSTAGSADTETALERFCDREGLRRLSLIQQILFQQMRRSEINQLEEVCRDRALRLLLCRLDKFITTVDDTVTAKTKRAAGVRPEGEEGSDDA